MQIHFWLSLTRSAYLYCSFSTECATDLLFSLSHTNSDLYESVWDSLIASELHELWGHWNTEFLGHFLNLVFLWLSLESWWNSLKTLLSIHKSLKLSLWVILFNVVFILVLLFSSLLISLSNSGVHLCLHLLEFFFGGSNIIVFSLNIITKLDVFWH